MKRTIRPLPAVSPRVSRGAWKRHGRREARRSVDRSISIGHTIWSLSDGGMERGLLNIINRSDQQAFRHVVLCLGEAGPLASRVNVSNCRVLELRKRPGNDVILPVRIATWAKRLRLDILHARGWPALVETAVGGLLAGVRRTVYGFHGKTMEELKGKSLRRRLAEMLSLRLYSGIVTLNASMQTDIARECRLDPARVRIIQNGVDTDVFRPTYGRRALRAEFALPVDAFVIGNVARLDPVKNHAVLLRSLCRLRFHGVAVFLILVGEGSERRRLEDSIRESGLAEQVRLFGRSDRVCDLLNCMDVYVQPSLYEGFSNTVLEAMACGLPVVATRTGGTTDVLREGQDGHLFDPDDDQALASRFLELRDEARRHAMGMSARRHVLESFPLAKMVHGYEAMYRDLAASR